MRRLDEYIRQLGRAARLGQVDVEALLRNLVLEVVAEIRKSMATSSPSVGGGYPALAEVKAALDDVSKRIEELKAVVERVVREVAELRQSVQPLLQQAHNVQHGGRSEPARGGQVFDEVMKLIVERGYVLLSEVGGARRFSVELLRRYGLLVLDLGDDKLVASPRALMEFMERLEGIRTPDESEAANKLGHYSQLFHALRRAGLILYRDGWRTEQLRKLLRQVS